MKRCPCCGVEKIESGFGRDKHTKSGRTVYCIKCLDMKSEKYEKSQRGRLKARNRARRQKFLYPEEVRHRAKMIRRLSNTTSKGKFWNIKSMAKRNGRECLISQADFIQWFDGKEKVCHYCGGELRFGKGGTGNFLEALTIDRKDNRIGYVSGNLALACRRCNTIKGQWLTEAQMIEIANRYLKQKGEGK